MRPRQEIRADHLQTVPPRLVRSEHESRRLDCLLDHRDLALVELEVDDFRRTWVIEGPGKERARIAYAGDEVRYSFPEKTAEVPAV